MLTELIVKNFALIEELRLSFGPGFNVLTGETGAGKSIIVGAINLILGGRASSDLIREGTEEAEVQALFAVSGSESVRRRLDELGLPFDDEIIVRRVLPANGRNRIYINGALATLAQLTALGAELIALSGQHEHQQLLDPEKQLLFVDQYGGLFPLRSGMGQVHEEMVRRRAEAASLERKLKQAREKAELAEFQAREIETANLTPGEDEELERERTLLRNAEKIYSLAKEGYDRLYGEAGSVMESLDVVRSELSKILRYDDRLTPTFSQVEGAFHELDDAAFFLRDYLERMTFDPERLEQIEERLVLINKLKRKYGPNLDDILNYGREAANQLDAMEEMERSLARARTELDAARKTVLETARELSSARREAAGRMAVAVAAELRDMGMPKLEFDIRFEPVADDAEPGPAGWDEVEFMVSPNLGERLKPLARIASGGELSRTMLGLKSLLAGQEKVETVIFDEVDAGIGGAVAEVVGRKIHQLSRFHQLLCITHLPQIAAFGRKQYLVFKEIRGQRTVTDIRPLSDEERVEEIARMLSGAEPSAHVREAAREMIARSGNGMLF